MVEDALSFDVLMTKVRLGDGNALATLLQRYEHEVHRVARCLLGRELRSALDPMDLVQSVHRTLILGFRANKIDVPSPQKLIALAVTVARHKVQNAARRIERQRRHANALAETAAQDAFGTTTPCGEPDPARAAAYNETLDRLKEHLSETDRRVVELRLQGYNTAEVAQELGVNADVLRVRLSRLRQQLRDRNLLTEWI